MVWFILVVLSAAPNSTAVNIRPPNTLGIDFPTCVSAVNACMGTHIVIIKNYEYDMGIAAEHPQQEPGITTSIVRRKNHTTTAMNNRHCKLIQASLHGWWGG